MSASPVFRSRNELVARIDELETRIKASWAQETPLRTVATMQRQLKEARDELRDQYDNPRGRP